MLCKYHTRAGFKRQSVKVVRADWIIIVGVVQNYIFGMLFKGTEKWVNPNDFKQWGSVSNCERYDDIYSIVLSWRVEMTKTMVEHLSFSYVYLSGYCLIFVV